MFTPAPPALPALPKILKKFYHDGKLAVLVGAGLSLGRDVTGNFPGWTQLLHRLLDACDRYSRGSDDERARLRKLFTEEALKRTSLETMLDYLGVLRGLLDHDYQSALLDIFRPTGAQPGAAHRALAELQLPLVLTTNYDGLLEFALDRGTVAFTWKQAQQAQSHMDRGAPTLFKIHGTAEDAESVILSTRDYDRIRSAASYQTICGYLFKQKSVLFVGFGMNDPQDLDILLRRNQEAFGSAAQRHFALLREEDPLRLDIADRLRREYNVEVIWYQDHAQLPELLRAIGAP